MLDAAVRQLEYRLDVPLEEKKRRLSLVLPAVKIGVEFRMANALAGSLRQLANLRKAFEGELYVMTDENFYRVGNDLEEVNIAEFWNSLA